jgi:hypothetical protein
MGNSGENDGHEHVPDLFEVSRGEIKIRNCSCKAIKYYYRFILKCVWHFTLKPLQHRAVSIIACSEGLRISDVTRPRFPYEISF